MSRRGPSLTSAIETPASTAEEVASQSVIVHSIIDERTRPHGEI